MKTVLIDSDSLIYQCAHLCRDSTDIKDYYKWLDDKINWIIQRCEATHYLLFLSSIKNFRKDIATIKEYKGNRKHVKKPLFFYDLRHYLMETWGATQQYGIEADDLMGIYHSVGMYHNYIYASPDKDIRQLAGVHFDYNKDKFIGVGTEQAAYNFWYQMIVGDSGDGVAGCKGKGPVFAEKLLKALNSIDMMAGVMECYVETYGLKQGVNNFTENFNLLYLLREHSDVEIKEPIEWKQPEFSDPVQQFEIK